MALIKAGAKIRSARERNYRGTFGCLVQARDDPSVLYILSAAHVLGLNGYGKYGDVIEAQTFPDVDQWEPVAVYEKGTRLRHADGALHSYDAGLARVTRKDIVSAEIDGIGFPGPATSAVYQGMRLQFRGAGTGVVDEAVLHSSGAQTMVSYPIVNGTGEFSLEFVDQILYGDFNGADWNTTTRPMDSGALVVTESNLAVGLHIAVTPRGYPISASVCTPMQTILDALDVDLVIDNSVAAAMPSAPDEVSTVGFERFKAQLRSQLEPHNPYGGIRWQLSPYGLIADGKLDRTGGPPATVERVWQNFGQSIRDAAMEYMVPVELIVATICTESWGRSDAVRIEPGWIDDHTTPWKVSLGLMQTLLSSAREALQDHSITRNDLIQNPQLSIRAGTAFIANQRGVTQFDPPLVACAYNAGHLEYNDGPANRWKIRQYPLGTGAHADRFVQWFNDCFAWFDAHPQQTVAGTHSLYRLLKGALP